MDNFLRDFTGGGIRDALANIDPRVLQGAREIRIRQDKPLMLYGTFCGEICAAFCGQSCGFVDKLGRITQNPDEGYPPSAADMQATLEHLSGFSLYAFNDELRRGYITIPGGHRVGICGHAVSEQGHITTLRHISSLNIRITRQVKGCAAPLMDFITLPRLHTTMIISPPGCGKTTLLRDMIRLLSDSGCTVGVADERSEVAGCYMGIPQNDMGLCTDVLDGCPKAEGMLLLLRSMSPDIIAVDEIGGEEDINAIGHIANAGVRLLCTAHGYSLDDVRARPAFTKLLNMKIFERYIVLENRNAPGEVCGIYDKDYMPLSGQLRSVGNDY